MNNFHLGGMRFQAFGSIVVLIGALVVVTGGEASAYLTGNGGTGCGSCEEIIVRQPEDLQTQAREIQKLLESKDGKNLGILIAAGNEVCDLLSCQNLSPEFVARLASRVEESRFRNQTDARLDWQNTLSIISVLIAFGAMLVSFFAFRKKRVG